MCVCVCVYSLNEAHHSTLRSRALIDGSLTTNCKCISYNNDVFRRSNLAPGVWKQRTESGLFRDSADTHTHTRTHAHAHARAHTHCNVHALNHRCQAAWGSLLFYCILTFQDRCKSNEVFVSESGPQWEREREKERTRERKKQKTLKASNDCLRKTIHSGPQEQDPSVWM